MRMRILSGMRRDEIEQLAALARLELSDEEVTRQITDMDAIVNYIQQLNDVDVANLEPTSQVTGLMNVLRQDESSESTEEELTTRRGELLANTADVHDGFVRVPGVFAGGSEE